jgi:hypothetical protein
VLQKRGAWAIGARATGDVFEIDLSPVEIFHDCQTTCTDFRRAHGGRGQPMLTTIWRSTVAEDEFYFNPDISADRFVNSSKLSSVFSPKGDIVKSESPSDEFLRFLE